MSSPLRNALGDVGGVVFAIAVSTVFGFVVWLATPAILLGARDWRRLLHGALVSATLGVLLGAASGIYVPVVLTWSADRYGLIGVAFTIQSWLLAAAFVVVIGAVVGAVASQRPSARLCPPARPYVHGGGWGVAGRRLVRWRPEPLVGDDLAATSLGARIVAVCDAFDAMTSDRPYRRAMSADAAIAELAPPRRHAVRRGGNCRVSGGRADPSREALADPPRRRLGRPGPECLRPP